MPIIIDEVALAGFLNIRLHKIMYSLINVDKMYKRFKLTKKQTVKYETQDDGTVKKKVTRTTRDVAAPDELLKHVQHKISKTIFDKYPLPEYVTGFRKGIGCTETARKHTNKSTIISMDIQDYFPSIRAAKVRWLLEKFGYNFPVSNAISELVSIQNRLVTPWDRVTKTVNSLPQGSPASPTISNIVTAETFGPALVEIARKYDLDLTCYVDDITYSTKLGAPRLSTKAAKAVIAETKIAVRTHGFYIKDEKTQVQHQNHSQYVMGINVNNGMCVNKRYQTFKAVIHNVLTNGWHTECARWMSREISKLREYSETEEDLKVQLIKRGFTDRLDNPIMVPDPADVGTLKMGTFMSWLRGQINWVCSVNPRKGDLLMAQYNMAYQVYREHKFNVYSDLGLAHTPGSVIRNQESA